MSNFAIVMNFMPGLTIVIPVRDRARIVGRTLDSVAAQTLRPLRVVLVDNGSTDGTRDVLDAWSRDVAAKGIDAMVVIEDTPGGTVARNRGIREVTTEWTMFFDSDDTMEPEHCSRAMDHAAGADIVGWSVRYHALDGSVSVKPFYDTDMQYHSLMHGSMATQRYMARTSLFIAAGAWNNRIKGWNDIELGSRLIALNPRVCRVEGAPTVDVWATEESITGRRFSDHVEQYQLSLEAIEGTLGPERGRLFTDLKRAILAADCRREGAHMFDSILGTRLAAHGLKNRLLLRLAYYYRMLGGRGAARLFRPLL